MAVNNNPAREYSSGGGATWVGSVDRNWAVPEDTNTAKPFYTFADAQVAVLNPFWVKGSLRPEVYNLQGLNFVSWSKHRDKYPVIGHGKSRIHGWVYGPRTVAGSIGFSLMGRSAFANLITQYNAWRGASTDTIHVDVDDLPPLDLLITFTTPQGNFASVYLRSVTFVDESLNLSVRDSNLTEVYSWMAASCTNVEDREKVAIVYDTNTLPKVSQEAIDRQDTYNDLFGVKGVPA